jgi:transcriptional regulator with XRE-family HTH domain
MQWGLSQPELSALLGISESALCKFETQARQPTKSVILGTGVIFGQGAQETFPAIYAEVERNIMHRAAALSEQLEGRRDAASTRKRRLLAEMIERLEVHNNEL